VRTIDRFLMFYVFTADRLQRTASWLESLDGGLEHPRAVVMDDSLGICAELVPRQATFALLMVSALVMTSRSRGWVAACRFRQAM